MLTKLEDQILMSVWKFKGQGYGINIFQHLNEINDKRITLGVVYDVLERLSKNGYVETLMGEPTPTRGGMRKKYYKITNEGITELIRSKEIHDKIMDGFQELVQNYKVNQNGKKSI